jgi:hypothetical protein
MTEQTITVADIYDADELSPYAIIKGVNVVLEAAGVKPLPPQMGYNYDNNGLFTGVKRQRVYTRDEARTWANKYLAKKLA